MNFNNKKIIWIGRIMHALVVVFMLFDGVIHVLKVPQAVDAFIQLGFPLSTLIALGIIELLCLFLYIVRRTSVLGAILLTGYLGGAVAANLRVGYPLFSNILFPVYVGIVLWAALYIRNEKFRSSMQIF